MIHGKQPIKSDLYRTPQWLFNQLNAQFAFTVDAAATKEDSKCDVYFNDGLNSSWDSHRVFCNPPFSQKAAWMDKASYEVHLNNCPVCVMILPMCLDTKAFNEFIDRKFYWRHLPYRISFLDEDDQPVKGNVSGTIIVYMLKEIERSV